MLWAHNVAIPPFQNVSIRADSTLYVNYEGVEQYNYLYCKETGDSYQTLLSIWTLNGVEHKENWSGGIIFDSFRADSQGTIQFINNEKQIVRLSCEYEFEPPT